MWIFRDSEEMPWVTNMVCPDCQSVITGSTDFRADYPCELYAKKYKYCPNCGRRRNGDYRRSRRKEKSE